MRKTTFFILFFFISLLAFTQGNNPVFPISWDLDLVDTAEVIRMPALDLSDIHLQDSINDLDKTSPWRYGLLRPLSIDIQRQGTWTTLENGGKLWLIAIKSLEALNISINFEEFSLPEGSRLQLFSGDRREAPLTYTSSENPEVAMLGTWFIEGETVWIEYFQPPGNYEAPRIKINEIIHGYRMGRVTTLINGERGINESGQCHYDINCSIGVDFDTKKDLVKKAVALLNLGNGYLCSAALLNNVQKDKTPYLLTANHCLENSDPALWSVRFNWVSPSPSCGTGEPSGDVSTNFTMSGAELKAKNNKSDFALVELYNSIPSSWDVAFAGWDNSDTDPLFEVGIHHPNGDIMKVCRDDSGAEKRNANGTEVWLISGGEHGNGNGWEIGTTENGSSGSPLFNENGKIIGQLYAGDAGCIGNETNDGYDLYGRFAVSWNSGDTPGERLMDWLDPLATGQTSVETLQNLLNVPDFEIIGDLKIYPNPAKDIITVRNNRYPNLSFEFFNTLGQRLFSGSLSNTMNSIAVDDLAEGFYFLHLIDGDSNDTMTKKIVIKK